MAAGGGVDTRHGSSPLARGTLHDAVEAAAEARFIPARAGNTRRRPSGISVCPVHPRSRGEHGSGQTELRCDAGSSPLARGTQIFDTPFQLCQRFIPARAGNTPSTYPR